MGLILIGVRVGLLGAIVLVADMLLTNAFHRDVAVLLAQFAVEWLLLGLEAVKNRARCLTANGSSVASGPSIGGDND